MKRLQLQPKHEKETLKAVLVSKKEKKINKRREKKILGNSSRVNALAQ